MRKREQDSRAVSTTTPALDLIFDLLSDRRRRYALYCLSDRTDGVADVDELTDAIVRLETETGHVGEAEADQHRLTVRTELQHSHLPKLADTSLLEHDPRSDTVRYWSQPSLEEWLEHAKHKEL
ncbi:DUF7344 domain-containing protein [Natronococcus jeotgali]|uniref:DUF7344 domain-containing protein n=1 Tax=Natronococcus jeotgali DSM 18795 TaxID=1227498 RepID=L9X9A6_9EURY|nr:hypothetical protein [Natronococcus jeotgali]ELY57223.1 hypothetical protein C492_13818 [Natronococcus jeotgali DSM 18795]